MKNQNCGSAALRRSRLRFCCSHFGACYGFGKILARQVILNVAQRSEGSGMRPRDRLHSQSIPARRDSPAAQDDKDSILLIRVNCVLQRRLCHPCEGRGPGDDRSVLGPRSRGEDNDGGSPAEPTGWSCSRRELSQGPSQRLFSPLFRGELFAGRMSPWA